MDKIKHWDRNSLKWKMIPYIVVMGIVAYAGLAVIGNATNEIQDYLIRQYGYQIVRDEILYNENGEPRMSIQREDGISWEKEAFKTAYTIVDCGQVLLGILWVLLSLSIPGWLFYRFYLKKPLAILTDAAENIKNQNLDFQIAYNRKDEMGQVCTAFEQMRVSLQENNFEMWRQMEDRRRLNAAFAHDLRTPLTVLQGQSEMLLKYIPDGRMPEEKIVSTVKTMQKHILRLEDYVTAMNTVQRLEDIEVVKKMISIEELKQQLLESGRIICQGKNFQLHTGYGAALAVTVDPDIVMQVYENLLINAVRYADKEIHVTVTTSAFSIKVSDDGTGFKERDLEMAVMPFYKASGESDSGHFGMGLNICKVLCEKHGGFLKIMNEEGGGAGVLAVFE